MHVCNRQFCPCLTMILDDQNRYPKERSIVESNDDDQYETIRSLSINSSNNQHHPLNDEHISTTVRHPF